MLKSSYDFLECSDKSSTFNSFAFTPSAVLYLRVIGGTNFFVHWWMKGIYFASFYFRVWDLTRENKNPAKISTYTVVTNIWSKLWNSIQTKLGITVILSKAHIRFGIDFKKYNSAINLIILLSKFYIYRIRCWESTLSILALRELL